MTTPNRRRRAAAPLLVISVACAASACATPAAEPPAAADGAREVACPIAGAAPADHLIEPGETHFARLWKLTSYGDNAEGYWSFDGRRISLQRTDERSGVACDQIYVTALHRGPLELVSTGRGATTCAYFLPGDAEVLFASTHAAACECPTPPDRSRGYVWAVQRDFDIYVRSLAGGELRPLIAGPGYDAEATVSPLGDRLVFTSSRTGDLELFTAALDGSDLRQVTESVGYDGGAFFSHDGRTLVFRSTRFADDPAAREAEVADYQALLADSLVRPTRMELQLCDADGGHRRALTDLGGANWAPYFFPGDERVLFASNHHDLAAGAEGRRPNFDLFAIDVDGGGLERVTTHADFDSFPMFSPDGRFLVFASNRGGEEPGVTNLFVAEWR
jgi:hypothetical protein